jgi:hypothetical protein
MKLADQWKALEAGLPPEWEAVRLSLTPEQPADLGRAAQVLGPIDAGRVGTALVFEVTRAAGPHGGQRVARLFQRLDEERTWCTLEVASVSASDGAAAAAAAEVTQPESVAAGWDAALASLPSDWSDLLCELEIESSALLDRTALLCAPINPARAGARNAFTFRCSSGASYGVSRSMARRCFERLDEEGISGLTRVLRVLSDTDTVYTQGPVWLVGGKTL